MDRRAIQSACRLCRERHVKCDQASPACGNCQKAGHKCLPAPCFQFKEVKCHGQEPPRKRKRHVRQQNREKGRDSSERQGRRQDENDGRDNETQSSGQHSQSMSPQSSSSSPIRHNGTHSGTHSTQTGNSPRMPNSGEHLRDPGPLPSQSPTNAGLLDDPEVATLGLDYSVEHSLDGGSAFDRGDDAVLHDDAVLPSPGRSDGRLSGPEGHDHQGDVGFSGANNVHTSPGQQSSFFGSPENESRDPMISSSYALFQHPPAVFGLPLTATISTDYGAHGFAGPTTFPAADHATTAAPPKDVGQMRPLHEPVPLATSPTTTATATTYHHQAPQDVCLTSPETYGPQLQQYGPLEHGREQQEDQQRHKAHGTGSSAYDGTSHSNAYPSVVVDHTATATATSMATADVGGSSRVHAAARVGRRLPYTPLQAREAHLVKFFMQTWGPLLDCNDPERHFALQVPRLALTKAPFLLSAILTISALQLSRVSDYPLGAAKYYRRQCGRSLIPVLQDLTNHETEGAIFTTYVLLRIYDQMTVALRERLQDSLFSSSLALSTSPWLAYRDEEGILKRAAFWVHVREDIHVALFLRCPIKIDYVLFQQNFEAVAQLTHADCLARGQLSAGSRRRAGGGGDSTADDESAAVPPPPPPPPLPATSHSCQSQQVVECAWSNQIIGLTCDVINFCFGEPEHDHAVETWAALLAKVERWNLEKPPTFMPFHEQDSRPEENQVFPRIWLSCDWHVMGFLYYHLSLILLKSHRPGQTLSQMTTFNGKGEIINHTRILCGIVLTNPIAQALIVACHMINVAGVFLESPAEQNEVLQLLHMTRTATGWPVEEVEKRLREAWAKTSPSR
ncbi:hypothetical protein VTK73DRAFT_9378 [Phialemonium thermophilum]|uniref:Zn(2)-C6 fungal-type domain-containing protein n=1 Tax=Phialemonium thermophilum TaxID=223376 RepID=A0ABR3W2K6_9PEZI